MKREEESKSKKKKYIILAIVFAIVTVVGINMPKIVELYNDYVKEQKLLELSRKKLYRREAIKKDDGWYYFIENTISVSYETGEDVYQYYFNGCNLKYETLDYVHGAVYDIDGNWLYDVPIVPPSLVSSSRSVDETKTEREEAREINDLFEKNLFIKRKITENDLSEIEFKNFKSEDIVTLWNMVQDDKYIKSSEWGPYYHLNVCNFKKENKDKNYWQIGVLSDYGFPREVVIDYVDENGKYLSDKIANNEATEGEKKIYNNVQEMGKYIVDNVTFNIKDKYKDFANDDFYAPIFSILEDLESVKE